MSLDQIATYQRRFESLVLKLKFAQPMLASAAPEIDGTLI
jgi:hypothetical protein